MYNVVLNEVVKEVDKTVLKCYYNICKYYNVNLEIIEKYIREINI